MQAKIEKVTFVEGSDWEWPKGSGTWNFNFIVKVEGVEDKRYVYVSKDKANPKIQAGMSADFVVDETKTVKVSVAGKNYEYPKIEAPKQAFSNGFGGGGGGKSFTKSPEIFRNEMVSYCSSYAKDVIIHRVNLGKEPKEIIAIYEELVDGFVKASNKHIK